MTYLLDLYRFQMAYLLDSYDSYRFQMAYVLDSYDSFRFQMAYVLDSYDSYDSYRIIYRHLGLMYLLYLYLAIISPYAINLLYSGQILLYLVYTCQVLLGIYLVGGAVKKLSA
jgi:hypothetical protein